MFSSVEDLKLLLWACEVTVLSQLTDPVTSAAFESQIYQDRPGHGVSCGQAAELFEWGIILEAVISFVNIFNNNTAESICTLGDLDDETPAWTGPRESELGGGLGLAGAAGCLSSERSESHSYSKQADGGTEPGQHKLLVYFCTSASRASTFEMYLGSSSHPLHFRHGTSTALAANQLLFRAVYKPQLC